MDQPVNLKPYGDANVPAAAPQADDIMKRAAWKLHMVRTTGQRPVDGNWRLMGKAVGLGLVVCLLLAVLALAISNAPNPGLWWLLPPAGACVVVALVVWSFLRTRPVTPKATLAEYMRAVAASNFARARALVVDGDLDHMPRYHPVVELLGRPDQFARPFVDENAFADYWRQLVKRDSTQYCLASLHNVSETQLADDVVQIDCEVKFVRNSQLWGLVIFLAVMPGLLLWFLLDLATRKRVRVPLRKIMVRTGDTWRVFNAELMGVDDHDLRWLDMAGGTTGHATAQSGR